MNKLQVILLLLPIFASSQGFSAATDLTGSTASADSILRLANTRYVNRDFIAAAEGYESLINMGYDDATLYFNLGNACYKQNLVARAILSYERALLRKPGDSEIKRNLALANARTLDRIEEIPVFFIKTWAIGVRNLLQPNQWALAAVVLFGAGLGLLAVYAASRITRLRKAGFSAGAVMLLLCLVSLLFMSARNRDIYNNRHAIIMFPSVDAKSSPDLQSTHVFVLHEGTRVEIVDSLQSWKEIRIADGRRGWIDRTSVTGI